MNLINDFEELKPIILERFLDFYEANVLLLDSLEKDSN